MKYLALALLLVTGLAQAAGTVYYTDQTVTKNVNCTLPLTREDGTPLATGDIALIQMYDRADMTSPAVQIDEQLACPFTVDFTTMTLGQHYIQMTATDQQGRVSQLSVDDARGQGVLPFELRSGSLPVSPTGLSFQ